MSRLSTIKVLVLNKGWQAVGVVSVEKALKLLCAEYRDHTPKARILGDDSKLYRWGGNVSSEDWTQLTPDTDEICIYGVKKNYKMPEIIILTRYNKVAHREIRFCKRAVFRRDAYTCMYCGDKPSVDLLSMDHVKPKKHGGTSIWENIVTACKSCNTRKGAKSLEQAGMSFCVSGYKPFKPQFTWYKGDYKCASWSLFVKI